MVEAKAILYLLVSLIKGWKLPYSRVPKVSEKAYLPASKPTGFEGFQSNIPWKLPFVSKPVRRQRICIQGGEVYYQFRPQDINKGEPLSRSLSFSKGRGFKRGESNFRSSQRSVQGLGFAWREDRTVVEKGGPFQLCPCCIGCGFISWATEVGDLGPDWLPQELGDLGSPWDREIHIGNEVDTYGTFLHSPGSIERLQPDDPWWHSLRRHEFQVPEHNLSLIHI